MRAIMFERFYPDERIGRAWDIDYARLYREGVRGVIFDIDNTLAVHGGPPPDETRRLFLRLRELGMAACLLSNNKEARVRPFAKEIGAAYICKANKPSVKGYEQAMERMGTNRASTVLVGDQLFTDVYGARRAGLRSILTEPIDPHEEIQIVLKRYLERMVLSFYNKKNQTSAPGGENAPDSGGIPETPRGGREDGGRVVHGDGGGRESEDAEISVEDELLDTRTGILYMGGNEEIYLEILADYVKAGPENLKKIRRLFEEKSWNRYVIEVHSLKSTSMNIGAKKLSEQAKELELAGKNSCYSVIEERNPALLELYAQVIESGKRHLAVKGMGREALSDGTAEVGRTAACDEISPERVEEYVARIQEACDSFDGDEAVRLCGEVSRYAVGGKPLKPLFEAVRSDAEDFEYERAGAKAGEIPEKVRGWMGDP